MSSGGTTVRRLVSEGARALPRRTGITDPVREASWLLAAALEVAESWLRVHADAEVPHEIERRFRSWIAERAAGAPAEHLVGACRFWGRDFTVSPQVLVPRPETELLVEVALELPVPSRARVLDVGTGSGCIAVTLAAERPRWRVLGVDRSPAALVVARANAHAHRARVSWFVGWLAAAVGQRVDMVTANLPYLPTAWLTALPVEVRREPALALDGGRDGLSLVRRLVTDLDRLVSNGGWCLLELAEGQADVIATEAARCGFAADRRLRDLGGCDRVLVLRRTGDVPMGC